MTSPPSESLNARRDAYLAGARALMQRIGGVEIDEVKGMGILTRAESVLDGQAGNLARLGSLDLEAPPADPHEAVATLLGAQHLPRMVICFSRALLQEYQDPSFTPFEAEAADLARDLALLTQEWVTRHQDLIGAEEDEGDFV